MSSVVSFVVRISVPKRNEHLREFDFSRLAIMSVPTYCSSSFRTSSWVKSDEVEYREEFFVTLEWEEGGETFSQLVPKWFSGNLSLYVSRAFECSIGELRGENICLQVFQRVN